MVDTPPKPLPRRPALTDRETWLGSWIACSLIASMGVSVLALMYFFLSALGFNLGSLSDSIRPLAIGVVGLGCLITVVAFVLHSRARGAAAKTLVRNDFRFCPSCVYDLREVEAWDGPCPECGLPLQSHGAVREYWERQYGMLVKRGRSFSRDFTDRETALARWAVWCGLVCVGAWVYAFESYFIGRLQLAAGPWAMVVGAIACVGFMAALVLRALARGRAARQLLANDLQFCPCCRYDLAKVQAFPGACPECGAQVESRDWLRVYWSRQYRSLVRIARRGAGKL